MAEDDHEKVKQKVGELKEAFAPFDEIGEHLTLLLEKTVDIEGNEELYDVVQDSYVVPVNEVRAYQKSSVAETITVPKLLNPRSSTATQKVTPCGMLPSLH